VTISWLLVIVPPISFGIGLAGAWVRRVYVKRHPLHDKLSWFVCILIVSLLCIAVPVLMAQLYSLVTARLIPMELHEWVGLRNKAAHKISKIRDPKERIERASQAMEHFNGLADPSWVISQQRLSEIRVKARREIRKKGG